MESREGVPGGLRLSYATLGAFTKYPKASLPHKPTKHVADKKFGFFNAQQTDYQAVAKDLGLMDSTNKMMRPSTCLFGGGSRRYLLYSYRF
jgi:dGTPase